MVDLYNTESGQLESVPDENALEAFTTGTHGLKQGDYANLYDPDTERTLRVPADKVKDYLDTGLQFETQEQQLLRQAKNDPENASMLSGLKQAGRQFVNQATFGIAEPII